MVFRLTATSMASPDYIEDANGNGVDDPPETPWLRVGSKHSLPKRLASLARPH